MTSSNLRRRSFFSNLNESECSNYPPQYIEKLKQEKRKWKEEIVKIRKLKEDAAKAVKENRPLVADLNVLTEEQRKVLNAHPNYDAILNTYDNFITYATFIQVEAMAQAERFEALKEKIERLEKDQ